MMLAAEYDGEQHWADPSQYAWDVDRKEYIDRVGWTVIRVVARHRPADVIRRVRRAWDASAKR